MTVDIDQRPGQFLLTGSAQVLALRELPDALPGRMEIVELWPFSQGELERSSDAFVDAAFARGSRLSRVSALRKREQERARLFRYRTKEMTEVDAILETPDGRVVGIEVKAGATIRSEDLVGLRHLSQRLGPRLVAGYVLYTGQQTLPFGDGIRALPIDALWNTAREL